MAEWVLNILNKPRSLIQRVKDRPGHDRRYGLNVAKIRNKLGWRPSIPLGDGLQATVCLYQDHRTWWEQIKKGEYKRLL